MEITLYDTNGDARAYIYNDKFGTIWTWDGHAVAYITRETIYGWRGHHIGWFVDDVIYDTRGYQVGFTHRRCPVSIHSEPPKAPKHAMDAKHAIESPHARPELRDSVSDQSLTDFVLQDAP